MTTKPVNSSQLIEWGVAARALPGESVSGDLHLVKPFSKGVLLAVVDGLGHGDKATAAAKLATATLAEHAEESVVSLVKRCHQAITKTRGVALSLAALHALEGTLAWLGVGNVEGILLRADPSANPHSERVFLRAGVVGYQLPVIAANVAPLSPGDLLIFVTDGIRSGFAERLTTNEAPQPLANRILHQHFKGNDDALVLVARYLGTNHE